MSEYTTPGLHPDADSLSAFIEGVLPEHGRLECLAHLSECAQCREIVFLAQELIAVEAPIPSVPLRKRWFRPIPVFSAAAVVLSLAVLITIVVRKAPVTPAPLLTAVVTPPAEMPAAPTFALPAPATPKIPLPSLDVKPPQPAAEIQAGSQGAIGGVPPAPVPTAAPFAPVIAAPRATGSGGGVLGGVLGGLPAAPPPPPLASISGSVTDSAGAVIPGATVTFRRMASADAATHNAQTDAKGQFNLAGLMPGPYEMKVSSPGFNIASQRVELQPREMAMTSSILQPGSSAQSVTVEAATSAVATQSSALGSVVAPAQPQQLALNSRSYKNLVALSAGAAYVLPNQSTSVTSAGKDKLVVAADSAGTLFLSKNGGKSWKSVPAAWPGKIVSLSVAPDPAAPANQLFQLATDSPAVWLSRDGNRWYPKK